MLTVGETAGVSPLEEVRESISHPGLLFVRVREVDPANACDLIKRAREFADPAYNDSLLQVVGSLGSALEKIGKPIELFFGPFIRLEPNEPLSGGSERTAANDLDFSDFHFKFPCEK
jgi:hypothetical protein